MSARWYQAQGLPVDGRHSRQPSAGCASLPAKQGSGTAHKHSRAEVVDHAGDGERRLERRCRVDGGAVRKHGASVPGWALPAWPISGELQSRRAGCCSPALLRRLKIARPSSALESLLRGVTAQFHQQQGGGRETPVRRSDGGSVGLVNPARDDRQACAVICDGMTLRASRGGPPRAANRGTRGHPCGHPRATGAPMPALTRTARRRTTASHSWS